MEQKKKRNKRPQEVIDREKAEKRKRYEGLNINSVIEKQEEKTKGERYFAREFKSLYTTVRKGLVLLENQRKLNMISNEKAYNDGITLINKYSNIDLE